MSRNIKSLDMDAVEYVAHSLAKEMMEWGEPIPEFGTRYPNILESCIKTPFQKFDGKFLYGGFEEKASVLFYGLIKNHPFQNGNKRIAVAVLLVILHRNKKWLVTDPKNLYNFVVWVAQSPPEVRDEVLMAIKKYFKKTVVSIGKEGS